MNIVITGASRGIGKALAEQYAAGGHTLFLCSRGETGLYAAMESLLLQFPQATIKGMPADVSDRSSAQKFASWVLEYAVPDVLINNAGNFIPGSINNEAEGVLEQMMLSNLYSAYHVTRTFLSAMMEKRSGYIFNMCSIAGLQAYPNGGAYSISKFALIGFSKNLRRELMEYGIKVTAVIPAAALHRLCLF